MIAAAAALFALLVAPPPPTPATCAHLQLHNQTAAAQACYQSLAASPDPYLQAEGDWGLELYAQANDAFRAAVGQADSRAAGAAGSAEAKAHAVLYRVRWGRLLQSRFNDPDAEGLFQEALQRDPASAGACLGLALVSADGFDGKALTYAHKAAALDPALAEAHLLLASLALEDSDPASASAEADLALQAQPDDLDAMALHAAIEVLALRPPDAWLSRIAAINPAYGEADAIVADQLVLNRRYDEGVAYYRKAVALDPELWPAHSALGITLMRLGQEQEPRTELELAYNHDYRDAATVNSLRLFDSYK
ncbi:MAG: hypothetical protein ACRD1L_04190, partial [Terriglobales bacterium]